MKRNITAFIVTVIIVVLIVPIGFAEDKGADSVGVSEGNPLTKAKLYNLVKENNIEYQLLNKEVERSRKKYESTTIIGSSIQNDINDPEEYVDFERRKYLGLKPLETKKDYLDKKYKLLQLVHDLEIKSTNNYFTLFILQSNMELKRDYYEYMGKKFDSKKTEHKLGKITQLDKKIFDNSYSRAYISLSKASSDYANQKRELNLFIDREIESPLYLQKQDIGKVELKKIDLKKTLDEIIANSYRIKALELEKDIAKSEKALKTRFKGFGEVAIEMDLLDDKIKELTAQIKDEKRKLEMELYNGYDNAKIAVENCEISSIEKEIAKKNYEISKLKFDNGMVSLFDLSELNNKYEQAYYNAMKSQLNQKIQLMEFEDFISENTVDITD